MAMLLEQNVDLDALLDAMPTCKVPPRIAHELAMERADRRAGDVEISQRARHRDERLFLCREFDQVGGSGAELVYFSPVAGDSLPADIQGVIFGGGYPEFSRAKRC